MKKKIAVVFYGPPGSGKTTQAKLIASQEDLFHFDSGAILEAVVHDADLQDDPVIKRERKLFDSGALMTPEFVLETIKKKVKLIAKSGSGMVFSGSPRTMLEAKGIFPLLEKIFGKENIFIVDLTVPLDVSQKRNSKRLICKVCKSPLLTEFYPSKNPSQCPICGGPLYKRSLDDKEIMNKRIEVYEKQTAPILEYVKEKEYRKIKLDGTKPPFKVFNKIHGFIEKS